MSAYNERYYAGAAGRVPAGIREKVLSKNYIDIACNIMAEGSPMEFLFDAYMEFVDETGEFEDWNCYKCREHVLQAWRNMKPYLLKLENGE